MTTGEQHRLIAWDRELSAAHRRLRQAVSLARSAACESREAGDSVSARAELLLYCHGFCTAPGGHHTREDVGLFPELAARYPQLRPTLDRLRQDHEVIATLLAELERALASRASAGVMARHLDGLTAIMESHFRYEERRLLGPLAELDLDADPRSLLGPL